MPEDARMPVQFAFGADGKSSFVMQGHGETVVLIHGVGMAASIWVPQFEALSKKYCVVAYDFLGHGKSSRPSETPELSEYVEQLVSLINAINCERIHVVGHSMGALIALEFALTHPERVLSVTALNAVYCRTLEQSQSVQQRVADLESGEAHRGLESTMSRWFDNRFTNDFPEIVSQVRALLKSVDPVGYARSYKLFARLDRVHQGRLANLEMPCLFITGEYDPNSTPDMSRAMANEAGNGRLEIVEGARHMMCVTIPSEVNRRLIEFLDTTVPVRANTALVKAMEFDQRSFRKALGSFLTGVTVVSTLQADGAPRGFTANSFSSVSLDPPLILVSIAKTAASYSLFVSARHFSVSVLSEGQEGVSGLFASKTPDKFTNIAWHQGQTGSPLINGAVAWFDCRAHNVVLAGDHAILIGEVIGYEHSPASPLGYCQGAYVKLGLSKQAIAGTSAHTTVGAILEQDGNIVLVKASDGSLVLPTGIRLEPASEPTTLLATLSKLRLNAKLGFLFAVFEDTKHDPSTLSIYYRGLVQGAVHSGETLQLAPLHAIPWEQIHSDAIRSMLQRYVRERTEDVFGIYVGNAEHGTIQAVMPLTAALTTTRGLLK